MQEKDKRILTSSSANLLNVAFHESGHFIAAVERGILPISISIDNFQGTTETSPEEENLLDSWDSDYILLAGCVAEHIYAGDFNTTPGQIRRGIIPFGSEYDFARLSSTAYDYVSDMMLYIHEFLLRNKWELVARIATTLYSKRTLDAQEIERIAEQMYVHCK